MSELEELREARATAVSVSARECRANTFGLVP